MRKLEETEAFKEIVVTLNRYDFKGICDKMEFDSYLYWDCILRHGGITGYHPSLNMSYGFSNRPNSSSRPTTRVELV
jgi:hypothetical protein